MNAAETARLAQIRDKVRHANDCARELLESAKIALQELRQDSGRRAMDDQPFLEAIAILQRAIDRCEGRVP